MRKICVVGMIEIYLRSKYSLLHFEILTGVILLILEMIKKTFDQTRPVFDHIRPDQISKITVPHIRGFM